MALGRFSAKATGLVAAAALLVMSLTTAADARRGRGSDDHGYGHRSYHTGERHHGYRHYGYRHGYGYERNRYARFGSSGRGYRTHDGHYGHHGRWHR